jgi:hypothetical protein
MVLVGAGCTAEASTPRTLPAAEMLDVDTDVKTQAEADDGIGLCCKPAYCTDKCPYKCCAKP